MALIVEDMPQLGITRVSRWVFNCYLIRGDDGGVVVVDAGLPRVADDLAPLLARFSAPVSAIVASHAHSDHVAGAPELSRRYDAPIFLPGPALGYLAGTRPRTPTLARAARTWPTMVDQPLDRVGLLGLAAGPRVAGYGTPAGMRWTGPQPAGGLTDGQPVPGAADWTVLAAPGHTDDSVALWHTATRTLLSGDAVLTARGRAWHTPEIVDTVAAARSRERLQQLPVGTLLPGHGRPVRSDGVVWRTQRR